MNAIYKDKLEKKTSEVSLGNLYDMNKQLMENEVAMSEEDRYAEKQKLQQWLEERFHPKYFMLLCHERRDYTLFNLNKKEAMLEPDLLILRVAAQDIVECLDNRGSLLSMTLQEDGVWEFWIKDKYEGCFAYYFFPYGEAVLEY